jgi:hypothetical protein
MRSDEIGATRVLTCAHMAGSYSSATSKGVDGAVAQLGERLNGIQEADSSILFSSTILLRISPPQGGVFLSSKRYRNDIPANASPEGFPKEPRRHLLRSTESHAVRLGVALQRGLGVLVAHGCGHHVRGHSGLHGEGRVQPSHAVRTYLRYPNFLADLHDPFPDPVAPVHAKQTIIR